MNEADNCAVSELELVEEMLLSLTNYCVTHNIPLSVRIGAEAEGVEPVGPCGCDHEALWRRENLDRILADINERICVIAGYEEETMDRRLHMLFVDLAQTLMPRT